MPDYEAELRQLRQTFTRDVLKGDVVRQPRRRKRDMEEPEPPKIPLSPRFEGMWVVGLPGTGKTQLFQHLIGLDLDLVAESKASIIVLDPTGDEPGTLIHNLTRLKRFAPGGDL